MGRSLTEEQLGFHKVATLPSDRIPYLIDNVVDTRTTAKAAVKALGGGIVLLVFCYFIRKDNPLCQFCIVLDFPLKSDQHPPLFHPLLSSKDCNP